MKKLISGILVSILTLSSLCADSHTESIRELLKVTEAEKQMLGGFEAMLPIVDQLAAQLLLNEQDKEELKEIYRAWYDQDIDRSKLLDGIVELYKVAFTQKEVEEMIAFFKTPTGQKTIVQNPIIMQKAAQLGMVEAQEKQAKLLERLQPFFDKHMSETKAPAE